MSSLEFSAAVDDLHTCFDMLETTLCTLIDDSSPSDVITDASQSLRTLQKEVYPHLEKVWEKSRDQYLAEGSKVLRPYIVILEDLCNRYERFLNSQSSTN